MTIKALFPTVRPTLNLDFAKTKALDPRITFTRASTATYVGADGLIQTAASGAARFDHNPVTGESLGLLVEEARTNLVLYSEQFDNAYWTKSDATVTANSAVSPDGTTTADLIYPSTTGSVRYVTKQIGISSSITTMSFFVKASGFTRCYLIGGTTSLAAWFDLSAGTVGTVTANCSATIQSFANGWFRCSLTQPALTNPYISIGPCDANNSFVATASSTNGIFVWGAQLEAGSFPTSYIPTSGATVTRAADVASMTGTNFSSWYRQDEGTVCISAKVSPDTTNASYINFTATSNNNDPQILMDQISTGTRLAYFDGTNGLPNLTAVNSGSSNVLFKAALGYKSANTARCFNGSSVTSSATAFSAQAFTTLRIGNSASGGSTEVLNSTIARLAYYPVRLPDAQLQALTAT